MILFIKDHFDGILLLIAGFLCWTVFHPGCAIPSSEVEAEVRKYFSDIPVLVAVAYAESEFNQFDSRGNVYVCGPNKNRTYDKGVMQINSVHWERAKKLGYDLDDIHGNMAFARLLYKEQGVSPWNSSSHRWEARVRKFWANR